MNGRLDEVVGDADLDADLLGQADLDGRTAIRLDALDLAAVSLNAADAEPADLGAIERFEHCVQRFGADDGDDEFHQRASCVRTSTSSLILPAGASSGRMRIAPSPSL